MRSILLWWLYNVTLGHKLGQKPFKNQSYTSYETFALQSFFTKSKRLCPKLA